MTRRREPCNHFADMMQAIENEDCRGRCPYPGSRASENEAMDLVHERRDRIREQQTNEQYDDYFGSYGMHEVYGTPQDVIDDDNRQRAADINAEFRQKGYW